MEWNIATLNLAAGAYAAHGVEWAASFDGGYVLHCDRLGETVYVTSLGEAIQHAERLAAA